MLFGKDHFEQPRGVLVEPHQLLRLDLTVGQQIQDLLSALRHMTVSGEAEHHGRQLGRKGCLGQCFAGLADRGLGSFQVRIVLRLADLGKGGVVALDAQPLTESPQGVDHAGQTGVSAEEDQPASLVILDPLIVDQCALEIEQSLQHPHVVGLALDDMGEVEVGPLGLEQLGRDLLDCEENRGVGNIGDDRRTHVLVLLLGESPNVRCLNHDLDSVGGQARHLVG